MGHRDDVTPVAGSPSPNPVVLAGLHPPVSWDASVREVADPEERPDRPAGRTVRRRLLPAPIWHIGKLLVVALIVEYLIVPQLAGTRKTLHLLSQVQPGYILLGVLLQVVGLAAYAQLTRSVLPSDSDPGLLTVLRIQLTTLSISHCVPGGTAAGSSLGYRLMTLAGGGKADVGFALAVQGIGSAVVLNVILWVALVVSIPVWGFSPLYLTAAVLGLVLFALFAGLILLMTKGEHWVGAMLERAGRRVPFVNHRALRRFFEQVTGRVRDLGTDRRLIAKAFVWAALNWLLDAGSLYVFVGAFGHWVNPDGLLVAFGLANILAAVPITPGGLGVVEATLTSSLVGFDTPRGIAILGVVGYRLINFWLPIPLGGLAYLSLQLDPGHTGGRTGGHEQLALPVDPHDRLVADQLVADDLPDDPRPDGGGTDGGGGADGPGARDGASPAGGGPHRDLSFSGGADGEQPQARRPELTSRRVGPRFRRLRYRS